MAVLFFDFDGTLADESHEIYRPTDMTVRAIESIRKEGHYAVLATGRAKCYVPRNMGVTWDGVISSNGSYAEINGKTVYEKIVPERLVCEFIEKAERCGCGYVMENQEECYTSALCDETLKRMTELFKLDTSCFHPVDRDNLPKVNKMLLTYHSEDELDGLKEVFGANFVLRGHRHNPSCDCDMPQTDKSNGILPICAAVGVDVADTYAFGDGANDYGMFSRVGHGIAMGEHAPILEEVCEYITGTVAEEGICTALGKYFECAPHIVTCNMTTKSTR